jgi:hypothetical protein
MIHLLVGEHSAQGRAPIDGDLSLVSEALLKELQEDPLGPLVVLLVRRRQLPLPVVAEAKRLQLRGRKFDK